MPLTIVLIDDEDPEDAAAYIAAHTLADEMSKLFAKGHKLSVVLHALIIQTEDVLVQISRDVSEDALREPLDFAGAKTMFDEALEMWHQACNDLETNVKMATAPSTETPQ